MLNQITFTSKIPSQKAVANVIKSCEKNSEYLDFSTILPELPINKNEYFCPFTPFPKPLEDIPEVLTEKTEPLLNFFG